jgi:hypothetical protein
MIEYSGDNDRANATREVARSIRYFANTIALSTISFGFIIIAAVLLAGHR